VETNPMGAVNPTWHDLDLNSGERVPGLAADLRRALRAAAGTVRRAARSSTGPGLHDRRHRGQPGRADRVPTRRARHRGFYPVYRFIEDYVLVPRIIGKVLEVPALATIVAVLLGVLGAVIAISAAAAIQLLIRELTIPQLGGCPECRGISAAAH